MKPFEAVVAEHGATVLRVCRARLGAADADDAWSETFLAALRAYPDLDEDANVEAWLVRIASRKAIDALRAAGRRPVPVAAPPDRGTELNPSEESSAELSDALAALPHKQRRAVALHHLGGLRYAEVAEVLGGTEAAARRAAADGIATLRRTSALSRPSAERNRS